MKNCESCARGWTRDSGNVCCGASAYDDQGGLGPIWSVRKYDPAKMLRMLVGGTADMAGTDCENMSPEDGALCKMWQERVSSPAST